MESNRLPQNLEIDILSMLPVESLLRFKCVCKSWCNLIASSSFIAKHLERAQKKNVNNANCRLLLFRPNDCLVSFLSVEKLEVLAEIEFHNMAKVLGSCNGIVCIYCIGRILMFNPATRKTKYIPVPLRTKYPAYRFPSIQAMAFGMDPKTNEYKVVMIIEVCDEVYDDYRYLPSEVQIYMVTSNTLRETDLIVPAEIGGWSNRRIAYMDNGVYSWLAADSESDLILSFHMGDEVFTVTRLPEFLYEGHCCDLAVLHGSFAIIRYDKGKLLEPNSSYFEIWVMNKSSGTHNNTWTKQAAVGPLMGVDWNPLAILGNGTFILISNYHEIRISGYHRLKDQQELLLYDLNTQELKKLGIFGSYTMRITAYIGSLVPIE